MQAQKAQTAQTVRSRTGSPPPPRAARADPTDPPGRNAGVSPSPAPATALAGLTWTDVAIRARATVRPTARLTERHGPHLPLSTDTEIATAMALRLAAARPEVVVAPAVAYGASREHAGFPGTLSIGQDALELMLLELGRSADGSAATVSVSAHGGNAGPLARAVARLRAEGRVVAAWSPGRDATPPGPAHERHDDRAGAQRHDDSAGDDAGRGTAGLTLTPAGPDLGSAGPGARLSSHGRGAGRRHRPLNELMPVLVRSGVAGVSANGVLGDTRLAPRPTPAAGCSTNGRKTFSPP